MVRVGYRSMPPAQQVSNHSLSATAGSDLGSVYLFESEATGTCGHRGRENLWARSGAGSGTGLSTGRSEAVADVVEGLSVYREVGSAFVGAVEIVEYGPVVGRGVHAAVEVRADLQVGECAEPSLGRQFRIRRRSSGSGGARIGGIGRAVGAEDGRTELRPCELLASKIGEMVPLGTVVVISRCWYHLFD